MYTFHLKIEKEKSELSLLRDDVIVGKRGWEEGRDMGRRLFESIAGLLSDNKLQADEVSNLIIDSEIPENYTSMRIAETVKKVYTFSVTSKAGKQAQK